MDEVQLQIIERVTACVNALCERGALEPNALIVLGCSTSEIAGGHIGHDSVPELGRWVARAMLDACSAHSVIPAFQCCEHLNRAIVLPDPVLRARGYMRVCAVPKPKAGGSVAAAAWLMLDHPALCEQIQADAGLDIGQTLIGMHIRRVAVPLRMPFDTIGAARITLAYARPPLIGGVRAEYE